MPYLKYLGLFFLLMLSDIALALGPIKLYIDDENEFVELSAELVSMSNIINNMIQDYTGPKELESIQITLKGIDKETLQAFVLLLKSLHESEQLKKEVLSFNQLKEKIRNSFDENNRIAENYEKLLLLLNYLDVKDAKKLLHACMALLGDMIALPMMTYDPKKTDEENMSLWKKAIEVSLPIKNVVMPGELIEFFVHCVLWQKNPTSVMKVKSTPNHGIFLNFKDIIIVDGRIYNGYEKTINVIDLATGKSIKSIITTEDPFAMNCPFALRYPFIYQMNGEYIDLVDVRENKIKKTIPVGDIAQDMSIYGDKLYVLTEEKVRIFKAESLESIEEIDIATPEFKEPGNMILSDDGHWIYFKIKRKEHSSKQHIVTIDLEKNKEMKDFSLDWLADKFEILMDFIKLKMVIDHKVYLKVVAYKEFPNFYKCDLDNKSCELIDIDSTVLKDLIKIGEHLFVLSKSDKSSYLYVIDPNTKKKIGIPLKIDGNYKKLNFRDDKIYLIGDTNVQILELPQFFKFFYQTGD